MSYVDGFVIPLKKARIDDYKKLAEIACVVWLEHGATSYVETISDDIPMGEVTSFPRAVQLEEDEVVVFSWITYPDKATRDACNEKIMADPRLKQGMDDMPFEGKRLIFGGFETFLER